MTLLQLSVEVIATVPFIPGHEAVGTVVKTGPASSLSPGARVGVENHFFCSSCYTCGEDRGDICATMNQYGHGRGTQHGGFSEFSIVSSKYCYVFKTEMPFLKGVLMEPLGEWRLAEERTDSSRYQESLTTEWRRSRSRGTRFSSLELDLSGSWQLSALLLPVSLYHLSDRLLTLSTPGSTSIILADFNGGRLELAKTMKMSCELITIDTSKVNLQEEVMRLTNNCGVAR